MGIIRRFVANPVAANMLMILLLAGGFFAALTIPRELFPEFELDTIVITVPYPGATPAEVERSVCWRLEDKLTGMEGVEELNATSQEGLGVVTLKLYTDTDVRKVLDDVKSEVDALKSELPKESEDPVVFEATIRIQVINVVVAGDERVSELALTRLAEEIRDEINDLPEVTQVSLSGTRDYEISVEVNEARRRQHELTLPDVAQAIRASSLDLPAGSVKTRGGDFAIRIEGRRYTAEEFRNIPVLTKPGGTLVTLGEIAEVREGFEDVDRAGLFEGERAVLVSVYKTPDEDSLKIAQAVREYVERRKASLPDSITLETWADRSKVVQDRLDMLINDGAQGLLLVFLVLWLFLGARLSFWVALGIPLSILGAILVLYLGGQTLNMMSMFALIMALGLIVDDAIVVGENVYSHVERGELPKEAAVKGTGEVLLPVVGAVATTWLAFMPLLFIPGVMGRFIEILPIAVCLSLGFSLLECLLILPPHLAHSLQHREAAAEHAGAARSWARRMRGRIDRGIEGFIHHRFGRLYERAARYRYATVAVAIGVIVVMAGAFRGGWIRVVPFPKIDSDTVVASLTMPTGTPISRTQEVAADLSAAARRLNEGFEERNDGPVISKVYSLLGAQSGPDGEAGSHIAQVIVELAPSEARQIKSEEIVSAWRESVSRPYDALTLSFGAQRGGPGGLPFAIRMLAPTTSQAEAAAGRLEEKLETYPGVKDIQDDALPGKMEVKLRLNRFGKTRMTQAYLAEQVRAAFYGAESLKVQRGRDEIKVMVRFPEAQRRSLGDIEAMRIRTPEGAEVPLAAVADLRMERGYTTLRRVNRMSVVNVYADIDESVANAEQILQDLQGQGFFAELESENPGVEVDLRGQRQQLFESLDALYVWFPIALLAIYTILAALFRSYRQPMIIMVAIPFGLIGAVVGHWIAGFDLTLMSLFGMVALAGIVVNDSLVLIDLVNRKVREGLPVFEAARQGSLQRFRPILLTTVTTVLGVTPLLFERSFQAQFLKPMAVSLAFGLSFGTLLTLLVVPSMYLIGHDLRRAWAWLRGRELPA